MAYEVKWDNHWSLFFLLILKLKNVLKYQTLYSFQLSAGAKLFRKAKLCRRWTKIAQKTKKWPKKWVFLRITATLTCFLVTLMLEKKCHILRHNITHKRVIYLFTEKSEHILIAKNIRFLKKNELGFPIHSKMG